MVWHSSLLTFFRGPCSRTIVRRRPAVVEAAKMLDLVRVFLEVFLLEDFVLFRLVVAGRPQLRAALGA